MDAGKLIVENMGLVRKAVKQALVLCKASRLASDEFEDIVTDTVLMLLDGRLDTFDSAKGAKETTFLVHVARNAAVDVVTSRFRRHMDSADAPTREKDGGEGASLLDRTPAPVGCTVEDNERLVALDSAVASLSDSERAYLDEYLTDGYSHVDYASRHGMPVCTVRTHHRRLLQKLASLVA